MKSFTISSGLFAVVFSGLLQNAVTAPVGSAGAELESTPEYKLTLEEMKEFLKTLNPLHGVIVQPPKTAETGPTNKTRSIVDDTRFPLNPHEDKEATAREKNEQEVATALAAIGVVAVRPDEGKDKPLNETALLDGNDIAAAKAHGMQPVGTMVNGERVRSW
ncbi:hypothetical protein VHEMI04643 [[Torrubiella] hemipterigena]|uniref:Uncharacterized protein n=1 Tax=[Torrubiella] hemipterigena TaxID=1531966 RepID=A0A0A1SVV4_9HYPO|nr:hypothetical protein VHEMI04643 [[Torrubiella] hemipterigena]